MDVWEDSVLFGHGLQVNQEVTDTVCRAFMKLVDMPVDVGGDQGDVKELVKVEVRELLDMREKAEEGLKVGLVVCQGSGLFLSDASLPGMTGDVAQVVKA